MPSGSVGLEDLMLSIAVLVILGVNRGGVSVRSFIFLCVLYISLSVEWCGSRDMDEI